MNLINYFCKVLLLIGLFVCPKQAIKQLTRINGELVDDNINSQTAGLSGPTLLKDTQLVEKLGSFDRERIPERVVHARGVAAKGVFTTTANLSSITKAGIFSKIGLKTPILIRFSTVINSKGSPETLRDPRGFAVKFYTSEGNWDLVGNNLPVFFIRDSKQFPDMVHSLKPDPVTNLQDPNRYFDFFSFKPEAIQMLTLLYSPLGIPANYRQMNGSGVHAYKFVNKDCQASYVKFTWATKQGVVGLTRDQASNIQSNNFNHATQDLYDNIRKRNFPKWDLYIQTIKEEDINKFDFNPLDSTKTWPESIAKQFKIGEMVLNEIPENFFQTTEQVAFCPCNLIPGIEASEDRLLQGRLLSYADTQRYRLGVNNQNLDINKPLSKVQATSIQDGAGQSIRKKGHVNYFPTRYDTDEGAAIDQGESISCKFKFKERTQVIPFNLTQNFKQAGDLYRSFDQNSKNELVEALGEDLAKVKSQLIRDIIASYAYKADNDYGSWLVTIANANLNNVERLANSYND